MIKLKDILNEAMSDSESLAPLDIEFISELAIGIEKPRWHVYPHG